MPLNQPQPPEALKDAFLDGIAAAQVGGIVLRRQSERALQFSLQLFTIRLSDLLDENREGAVQARQFGWQFLATDPNGEAFRGEVRFQGEDQRAVSALSLGRGNYVDQVFRALESLERVAEFAYKGNGEFELRRLRIAALRIDCLWFKSPPVDRPGFGENDRIFPFFAFQETLKNKLLTTTDFLGEIERLARTRKDIDNTPRLGGQMD